MKRAYRQIQTFALIGILLLFIHPLASASTEKSEAMASLSKCLKPDQTIKTASISIEATTSKGQAQHETYQLLKEKLGWIFNPANAGKYLRLNTGSTHATELSDTLTGAWHPATVKDQQSYSWLIDLALLMPDHVPIEHYQIKSDMKMAGKRYLTLVADHLDPANTGGFGQISLSVTLKDTDCTLLRAVYFDIAGKVWKKVFYHWQTVEGHTVWKNMHVEDTRTLDRNIYRFSGYQFKP